MKQEQLPAVKQVSPRTTFWLKGEHMVFQGKGEIINQTLSSHKLPRDPNLI